MSFAQRTSSAAVLLLATLFGGVAGYLTASSRSPSADSASTDLNAELVRIREELADLKTQTAPVSLDDQLAQLQTVVADILLRGDEFSLRADFARNADHLDGHGADDFAFRDADGDGAPDVDQLRRALARVVSGDTPVAHAKRADAAGNAEFLGNLALTDFALANHTHAEMAGDVRMEDDLRVDGRLTVSRNVSASGDVEVFGDVVAVGGLQPGFVEAEPKPTIAGMIRYDRRTGALEYCDGVRWHELAVTETR